jgi:hypothetical protein
MKGWNAEMSDRVKLSAWQNRLRAQRPSGGKVRERMASDGRPFAFWSAAARRGCASRYPKVGYSRPGANWSGSIVPALSGATAGGSWEHWSGYCEYEARSTNERVGKGEYLVAVHLEETLFEI